MTGRPCELKKLQALWDPRAPIASQSDPLHPVLAGLKALNAAEKVVEAAKEVQPGEKAFRSLQARVALVGMQLLRSDERDGPVRLFVVNGLKAMEIRNLDDLDDLLIYLQRER
jgi:hypothetical protein